MPAFDVFNGDADGLIARHQFRLQFPAPHETLTLITGVKRDIELVRRADAHAGDELNVFDLSYDSNADAIQALLNKGVSIRYFDHHRATMLQTHPGLEAHIDTAADVCTSLLVDRHIGGRFHDWAITAAFGDNLTELAVALAAKSGLSAARAALLRQLGEGLNYNAYGESEDDLHYRPADLAARMAPYTDPFEFIDREDVFLSLNAGYASDLHRAVDTLPLHVCNGAAIYLLPDEPWARRVSGAFANYLASAFRDRAHAICTHVDSGAYAVSIRAPMNNPCKADAVAVAFPTGGGRAAAAGINRLPLGDLPALLTRLEETYRQ